MSHSARFRTNSSYSSNPAPIALKLRAGYYHSIILTLPSLALLHNFWYNNHQNYISDQRNTYITRLPLRDIEVELPYNYTPRFYQNPFFKAMDTGTKRAVLVHHRRAGKDLACFNFLIKEAYRRPGNYWYMFPEYSQARKAIWEGITSKGIRYLDFIPACIIKSKQQALLKVELTNGSIIRLVGSDTDSLMGAGVTGIVLSEYSLIAPSVWSYIEPMIVEQGGWAVFNGTPRGENHFYDLFMMAQDNPAWYSSKLSIKDTGAISEEQIDNIRKEKTKSEETIQQEYYCSFRGSIDGAYYSQEMIDADNEGRISNVAHEKLLPVHTAWDLGVRDATSIWFYQLHGNKIRLIDYYQKTGKGLDHFIQYVKGKPYIYGNHYAPHDIKQTELGSGRTRLEMAQSLGLSFNVVPRIKVVDGINCVRATLSRCHFDKTNTYMGIQCLRQYRKDYDEDSKIFSDKPVHDWSSHGADAFRYLCLSVDNRIGETRSTQTRAAGDYISTVGFNDQQNRQFQRQTHYNSDYIMGVH